MKETGAAGVHSEMYMFSFISRREVRTASESASTCRSGLYMRQTALSIWRGAPNPGGSVRRFWLPAGYLSGRLKLLNENYSPLSYTGIRLLT